MRHRQYTIYLLIAICLSLTGCGDEVDHKEFLASVEGLTTPDDIIAAVGEADEISVDGALNQWRYDTDQRDICFMIAGNVALRMSC